jgi:hypothetical protein
MVEIEIWVVVDDAGDFVIDPNCDDAHDSANIQGLNACRRAVLVKIKIPLPKPCVVEVEVEEEEDATLA